MRKPRIRLTLGMAMILVAIVAAGLGYLHHRGSAGFRQLAAAVASQAAVYEARVASIRPGWKQYDDRLGYGKEYMARRGRMPIEVLVREEDLVERLRLAIDYNEAMAAYYRALEARYRRASAFPWQVIDPGTPPTAAQVAARSTLGSPSGTMSAGSPPPVQLVARLQKGVFELGSHPVLGGAIPLTIEYRNRSDRPVTVSPIGIAVVAREDGHEVDLTPEGRDYRRELTPTATLRSRSSIVLDPGGIYRDEGLDLTGLYRLPSGRYTVRVFLDDPPNQFVAEPVHFEVRRTGR